MADEWKVDRAGKGLLFLNKMPLNQSIVVKKINRYSTKREVKEGISKAGKPYGPFTSCWTTVVMEGKTYNFYCNEQVADVLDRLVVDEELEIKKVVVQKKDPQDITHYVPVYETKVVRSQGSPTLSSFPSSTVKLNDHEVNLFNLLWKEEHKETREEAEQKYDYFVRLMQGNRVTYRNEQEMQQLWKLYKDFLFAKRQAVTVVGQVHGMPILEEKIL